MAEVFIDGELVEFTGSPPATVGDLRAALEQAIAERGRVLVALTLAGAAFEEADDACVLVAGTRVDAATMSAEEALAQVAQVALAAGAEARAAAAELMSAVVREPWAEAQPRCVDVTSILSRMLESAITIAAHQGETSAVTVAVQHLSAALETWVNAVQAGDAAAVCLRTEDQLVPAISQVETALGAPSS